MNVSDKLPRSGYIQPLYDYIVGLIKKLDANTQSLRSRMNMLVASPAGSGGDVGTELRDIRAGYDGTTYTSAGDAVRGQVSGLKSTLNNILVPIAYTENTGYYFDVDGSLEADSNTTACVYTDKIAVYGGQTVKWSLGAYTYKHILWGAYMEYDSENNVIGSRNVFCNTSPEETKTASGEFTVSENASKIALCWRSYGQSNMLTGAIFYDNNFISDVGTELRDIRAGYDGTTYTSAGEAVRGQVNGLKSTLNNLLANIAYTENTGYYFNVDGSLIADSSANACVYTDKIDVCGGQTVKWSLGAYTYKHYLWGAYMEYNSKNEIIGSRKVFCNTSSETKAASGEFTISENASKIAFCWRSYGQNNMLTGVIFYDNNFISDVGTELRDIRIGYDGAEYETAGEAVRGQVSGLKSTLNNILVPIAYTENAGYYFSENGSLVAEPDRVPCVYTDKIDVCGGQTVKWSLGAYTYKHILWGAYMEYDSENNVIGSRNVFCNTSPEETKTASGEFTVSENASKIALCWRSYGQSNMLTGIIFYDNNFISDMNENRQHISNVENMLIYSNGIGAATELKKAHYIRYSDGVAIGSGGYLRYYTYVNPVFKHIKAFVYATDTNAAAIAFYSGTEINSETYMQEYSVQFNSNSTAGKWHEADVPDGCGLVVITTRTDYTNATPLVEFSGNDTIKILDSAIIENKGHIAEVDEKINAANGGVLFGIGKYFYHFGMAAVAYHDVPVNIPSQSIFDVRNAANLGYKCIECNIQKTLDNKYVVTHGLNGYLGHDFNDLNGNNVGGQIKISDVTFDDLRTLYVYRCTNPNYRTPITSLEEFLYECKRQGISVMAGYKDEESLNIARGIMGANLIMYNVPRRLYDGVILEWRSDATKEAILARCETVGKPYIYSMAEPASRFTDEELADIVKTLHNAGYYVASAYVGNGMRFLGLGFDFIAVDTDPNPDTVINGKKLIFN